LNYTRAAPARTRPRLAPTSYRNPRASRPGRPRRFSCPSPRPEAGATGPATRSIPAQAVRPGPPAPGSGGSPPASCPAR